YFAAQPPAWASCPSLTRWVATSRTLRPLRAAAAQGRRRRGGRGRTRLCSPPDGTFLPAWARIQCVSPSALITGGSSGIGLAIARMLRDEDYGLTLGARTEERLQAAAEELGALAVRVDVREEADCERLAAAHRERFGSLDVLVNSAGVGIGA